MGCYCITLFFHYESYLYQILHVVISGYLFQSGTNNSCDNFMWNNKALNHQSIVSIREARANILGNKGSTATPDNEYIITINLPDEKNLQHSASKKSLERIHTHGNNMHGGSNGNDKIVTKEDKDTFTRVTIEINHKGPKTCCDNTNK